ncbi:FAD-dependent monooxygenase [Roseibium sp. RKSG952]|uniref:FAD-dependent monooxygenase n=1 Tax=Roseibium sp. RKSG952 TaxID=2529384 RepID=UPI0012BB4B22|nr:FAD-dependent monooxygenase [Roseibium sp. RKSG952]MTH99424.1 FAD-binding protein [Roseibium sp. RKSG952]
MPQDTTDAPVIIAGAGIAGMTSALALQAAGHEVVLVERAPELTEVGAGLQLSPNACHVLKNLGVLDDLEPYAVAPEALRIRSGRSGRQLCQFVYGSSFEEHYGAPYWVVHRADLQGALLSRIRQTPGITLVIASEIRDVQQTPDQIACEISTSLSTQTIAGQALIAADGVWSQSRLLVPGHKQALFTGRTAYRATVPAELLPPELMRFSGLWLGAGAHLVLYPVRARREFNIVALVDEDWTGEVWSAPARHQDLAPHFEGWHPDALDLLKLPEAWTKWALCGVDANGPWVHNRIALIGDAAHAMLPFAAQGAAMAIEDAAVLGLLLADRTMPVPEALARYQALRRPRVARVQKQAEKNGTIYHMRGPLAAGRNAFLRFMPNSHLQSRMDWIYRWKPAI